MKLLILTQKIDQNDDVLGFMPGWISAFARECEEVTAVGLLVGETNLPKNVHVRSLGKEGGASRFQYVINFYRIIWRERKNYDAVFVHMNPEYVILGGILWRLMGKRIGLWYTHKAVNLRLRLATMLAHIIFTASAESFRLKTAKRHVVGHGIDTERFGKIAHSESGEFRIVTIGRLSKTKSYGVLLDALSILKSKQLHAKTVIVGGVSTKEDVAYATNLNEEIIKHELVGAVILAGGVPNTKIDTYLANADLFVNMSETGSLDKAVLEAMATGILVLTSNEGLRTTLGDTKEKTMFRSGNSEEFAKKIEHMMRMSPSERTQLGTMLKHTVVEQHGLNELVPRILGLLC